MLNADVALIDGVARNARNPRTFEVPDYDEIGRVHRGDSVKIGLEAPGVAGERFWVTVTDIQDRSFKGVVDNDLLHPYRWGVNYGDEIEFEDRHVLSILAAEQLQATAAA